MSDLPEYRKQRPIQPAPVVDGVREAYNAHAHSTAIVGEIGSQIAQNSANQMAQLKGAEEAEKNPGKELMPAWTESDKHFQQAFEKEVYSNAAFSATQLIQKQSLLVEQNPTIANLELFTKNIKTGLDIIIKNSPQNIQNSLKKALLESYNHSYFNLTRAVMHKNRADMISSAKVRVDENLKSMYNSGKEGFGIDAKDKFDNIMSDINSLKENGGIDAEGVASLKDTANNMFLSSQYNGMVTTAYREGEQSAADFIRDVASHPRKDLTPLQNEYIVKSMLGEYHRLKAESADSKHLALMDYQNDMENNTLTPTKLAEAQQVLGDEGFKKFTHSYNKGIKDNQVYTKISDSIEKKESLKQYSAKSVQKAFDRVVGVVEQKYAEQGKELGYIGRIQLAEGFNDDRLLIVKETIDKINGGSAQDIGEASVAIKRAEKKGLIYLNKVGDESRFIADLYDLNSLDKNKNPEEVAKAARTKVRDISPADLAQRLEKYSQLTKKSGGGKSFRLYDDVELQTKLSEDLGFGHWTGLRGNWYTLGIGRVDEIPTQLVSDYKAAMKSGYSLCEDLDIAHKNAIRLLKLKSGVSRANGKARATVYPLEKTFPFKKITRLRNDAVVDMSKAFAEQEEKFKKGDTNSYFKFASGALKEKFQENYVYDDPIYNGKEIEIIRVFRNLKGEQVEEEGYLDIDPDNLTGLITSTPQFLSYAMRFTPKDGGEKIDIYDPSDTAVELRFIPTLNTKAEKQKLLDRAGENVGWLSLPKYKRIKEEADADAKAEEAKKKDKEKSKKDMSDSFWINGDKYKKIKKAHDAKVDHEKNDGQMSAETYKQLQDEKIVDNANDDNKSEDLENSNEQVAETNNTAETKENTVGKVVKEASKAYDKFTETDYKIAERSGKIIKQIPEIINKVIDNIPTEKAKQVKDAFMQMMYKDVGKNIKKNTKDYLDDTLSKTINYLVDNNIITPKIGDRLFKEMQTLLNGKEKDYFHEINYLHIKKLVKLDKMPAKDGEKFNEYKDKLIKAIRHKDRKIEIKTLRTMSMGELIKMSDKLYNEHNL